LPPLWDSLPKNEDHTRQRRSKDTTIPKTALQFLDQTVPEASASANPFLLFKKLGGGFLVTCNQKSPD
jgi:hypothetical protein